MQQSARLENAARESAEAARLARVRYEAGAADLLTVLDAERTALAARDALVQSQQGSLTALVAVYRALGGGWTIPEAVVHLYAPALGVGLVALLAMPGQLWLDRRVDGRARGAWAAHTMMIQREGDHQPLVPTAHIRYALRVHLGWPRWLQQ